MDLRQIKNIIKEFEDSTIGKMEIEEDGFRILLEKNSNIESIQNPPLYRTDATETSGVKHTPDVADVTVEMEDIVQIKSPLVGTFYQSPSPDASPFVTVNQHVQKGDPLFIVEAMKVMNEVTAAQSGVITKINVTDASMVEYGQVIMEMKV
jgi:acetyl-CoA carboxylase biotin carboxyl carrier protein